VSGSKLSPGLRAAIVVADRLTGHAVDQLNLTSHRAEDLDALLGIAMRSGDVVWDSPGQGRTVSPESNSAVHVGGLFSVGRPMTTSAGGGRSSGSWPFIDHRVDDDSKFQRAFSLAAARP